MPTLPTTTYSASSVRPALLTRQPLLAKQTPNNGLTGGGVPWQQALQHAKHSTAKSLLPNFTLAALLTWLPVPLLHLTPSLGVGAFLASCGFTAATGLVAGKWPKLFGWLFR